MQPDYNQLGEWDSISNEFAITFYVCQLLIYVRKEVEENTKISDLEDKTFLMKPFKCVS